MTALQHCESSKSDGNGQNMVFSYKVTGMVNGMEVR